MVTSALLAAVLSSCSVGDAFKKGGAAYEIWTHFSSEFVLFWEEADDILDFMYFGKHTPEESQTPLVLPPDKGCTAELERITHIEYLPTPYNVSFIKDRNVTEKNEEGYLKVSLTGAYTLTDVEALFLEKGITPRIEERCTPSPTGEVFAVDFAGLYDGENFYVNPDCPVTLLVSGEKKAKTADSPVEDGKSTVYITFDDGPGRHNTVKLLDILDSYGIKAAFFTVGDSVAKYPENAAVIEKRGHVLSCHSMTHNYESIYASTYALLTEVEEWETAVDGCGVSPHAKLFRFPGGSVGTYLTKEKSAEMVSALADRGYFSYDWNVVTNDALLSMKPEDTDSYDYIKQNFTDTFELAVKQYDGKEPIIVLMHETVNETVDLLPWIIEYISERGYAFGDLSELEESWMFGDK